jgi:hypothetical protein
VKTFYLQKRENKDLTRKFNRANLKSHGADYALNSFYAGGGRADAR